MTRRARRNPDPAVRVLEPGTILYHGTCSQERFDMPRAGSWFSADRGVAHGFSSWCTGSPNRRILVFMTASPARLLTVEGEPGRRVFTDDLAGKLGTDPLLVYEPGKAARATCQAGHDGWYSADAYGPGQSDIMLCHPDRHLRLIVAQQIGRREPAAYRTRHNPASPPRRVTLPVGTVLYHGTCDPAGFDALHGPAWVTDDYTAAAYFALDTRRHLARSGTPAGEPRILSFRVVRSPSLAVVYNWRAPVDYRPGVIRMLKASGMEHLDRWLTPSTTKHRLALEACRPGAGIDGWVIPLQHRFGPGGSDIMLCEPDRWLEPAGTDLPWPTWMPRRGRKPATRAQMRERLEDLVTGRRR